MEKFSHTPGPWTFHRNSSFWEFGSDKYGQLGDCCASQFIYEGDEPISGEDAECIAEANARLVAAAPELLEALREVVEAMSRDGDPAFAHLIIDARAAIAKAMGE